MLHLVDDVFERSTGQFWLDDHNSLVGGKVGHFEYRMKEGMLKIISVNKN